MSLKANIHEILISNSSVVNYVASRIYQNERPQVNSVVNGLPCIVLNTVSTTPQNTKSGRSNVDIVRIQVDIFSRSPEDASDLCYLVRNALDYTGTDGSPFTNPDNECVYTSCVFEEERDVEYIMDSGNNGAYIRSMDFMVRIKQI